MSRGSATAIILILLALAAVITGGWLASNKVSGGATVPIIPSTTSTCVDVTGWGMVSWWPGDGNTVDVQDSNNGGWTGTPNYSPGMVNSSFLFSTLGDNVIVPNKANLNPTSAITLDAWIYAMRPTELNPIIVAKNGQYGLYVSPSGYVVGTITNNVGVVTSVTSSTPLSLTTWYHAALTFSGTQSGPNLPPSAIALAVAPNLILYQNGVDVAHTYVSGTISVTTNRVEIGKNFEGLIDEVEIYNTTLTTAQVQAIYTASSAGKCLCWNGGPSITAITPLCAINRCPAGYTCNYPTCTACVSGGGTVPTVTTNVATLIGTTSATFNGTANPNGATTTGFFRYSTVTGTCSDTFGTTYPASGGSSLGSGSSGIAYTQTISTLTSGTTYYYCAVAENSAGKGYGAIQSFTTSSVSGPTITTASPLPNGTVGTSYSTTLAASGGTTPYTWSTTTLPTNLTMTTSGVISGTPSSPGTTPLTVTVFDSSVPIKRDDKNLDLTINYPSPTPLTITTSSPLPSGTVGTAYSTTLAATGGTRTGYTWSIISGSLPAGLTLLGATISGTPTTSVSAYSTIQLMDSAGATTSKAFTITINPAGTTTGTLTGTVTGGSMPPLTPLNGANVSCTPSGFATTDSAGKYTISSLAAGSYNCIASKAGYNPSIISAIVVTAGGTTTQDFALSIVSGPACTGTPTLTFSPSPATKSHSVKAKISGLTNCDGNTSRVNCTSSSLTSLLSSCTYSGSVGCNATLTMPSKTGTYSCYANVSGKLSAYVTLNVVNCVRGTPIVDVYPTTQKGARGDALLYIATIGNNNTCDASFDTNATIDETDWTAELLDESNSKVSRVDLSEGDNVDVNLVVKSPASAGIGDIGHSYVIATDTNATEGKSTTTQVDYEVATCNRKNPTLTVDKANQTGQPGQERTYKITVKNSDKCSSYYPLNLSCATGWTCSLSAPYVYVLDDTSGDFTVKLTPGANVSIGNYSFNVATYNWYNTTKTANITFTYSVTASDVNQSIIDQMFGHYLVGDRKCDAVLGENITNSPADCASKAPGPAVCGNNITETGEDCDGSSDTQCPSLCSADCTCPFIIGDGICSSEAGESSAVSPSDCGKKSSSTGLIIIMLGILGALGGAGYYYIRRKGLLGGLAAAHGVETSTPGGDLGTAVNSMLSEGYNPDEIHGNLEASGWSHGKIDAAMGSAQTDQEALGKLAEQQGVAAPTEKAKATRYVKKCLEQGYDPTQIKTALISSGWPANTVDGVVSKQTAQHIQSHAERAGVGEPSDDTDKLKKYVKKEMSEGHTKPAVKKVLKDSGWSDSDIKDAFGG